jgi:hypothetical protein
VASKFAWLVRNPATLLVVVVVVAALAAMFGGGFDHFVSKNSVGFWEGPG